MIFPVKSINNKFCVLKEGWITVQTVLVQSARVIINNKLGAFGKRVLKIVKGISGDS